MTVTGVQQFLKTTHTVELKPDKVNYIVETIWYLNNCLYTQKGIAVQFSFASLKSAEDSSWKQSKEKKIGQLLWVSKKFGWDSMLQYFFFLMVAYDESVYMHTIYILF